MVSVHVLEIHRGSRLPVAALPSHEVQNQQRRLSRVARIIYVVRDFVPRVGIQTVAARAPEHASDSVGNEKSANRRPAPVPACGVDPPHLPRDAAAVQAKTRREGVGGLGGIPPRYQAAGFVDAAEPDDVFVSRGIGSAIPLQSHRSSAADCGLRDIVVGGRGLGGRIRQRLGLLASVLLVLRTAAVRRVRRGRRRGLVGRGRGLCAAVGLALRAAIR